MGRFALLRWGFNNEVLHTAQLPRDWLYIITYMLCRSCAARNWLYILLYVIYQLLTRRIFIYLLINDVNLGFYWLYCNDVLLMIFWVFFYVPSRARDFWFYWWVVLCDIFWGNFFFYVPLIPRELLGLLHVFICYTTHTPRGYIVLYCMPRGADYIYYYMLYCSYAARGWLYIIICLQLIRHDAFYSWRGSCLVEVWNCSIATWDLEEDKTKTTAGTAVNSLRFTKKWGGRGPRWGQQWNSTNHSTRLSMFSSGCASKHVPWQENQGRQCISAADESLLQYFHSLFS
jgi:hypothetical protein